MRELEPAVLWLEQVRAERGRGDRIAVWELCKRGEHGIDIDQETSRDDERAVQFSIPAISPLPTPSDPILLSRDPHELRKRPSSIRHEALE